MNFQFGRTTCSQHARHANFATSRKNFQEKISAAIEALQDAYSASVYPEQNSDWTLHPNNIGHKDSPGCFRCHDGKHLNADQEAIRLECNLCHSIPIVAGQFDFTANLEISRT
jgi:hypothetical protein